VAGPQMFTSLMDSQLGSPLIQDALLARTLQNVSMRTNNGFGFLYCENKQFLLFIYEIS
jgi:hypothetical protein